MMDIGTFFAHPSVWGIGLALLFGALWLVPFTLPQRKKPQIWLLLIVGAALFTPSIAWIQVPLQNWVRGLLSSSTSPLVSGIPLVLLSGTVQEGFKLAPVALYLWLSAGNDCRTRVALGAMCGAGVGICEAQWALNSIFALGWSWDVVKLYGFRGLAGFWERFFAVAFHIGSTAIAAYGLSRGKWWQFYLLDTAMHSTLNYGAILFGLGLLSVVHLETYVAVWGIAAVSVALWLKRRSEAQKEPG
jgi:hypothetical protein